MLRWTKIVDALKGLVRVWGVSTQWEDVERIKWGKVNSKKGKDI